MVARNITMLKAAKQYALLSKFATLRAVDAAPAFAIHQRDKHRFEIFLYFNSLK